MCPEYAVICILPSLFFGTEVAEVTEVTGAASEVLRMCGEKKRLNTERY